MVDRRHPDALCEECPLFEIGTTFTPSFGPEKADLVIVGEAPGYEEAKKGKPFQGPSGKLLDTVLQHHGLDRSKAFVTNTVLCRRKTNIAPTPSEIRSCLPRLQKEITSRGPQTILALGNSAAKTVLQTTEGVTKLRVGMGKESPLFPGVRVIPTIHPAGVMRQAAQFPNMVTDIGKVKYGANIRWIDPEIHITEDPKKAIAWIRRLHDEPRVTLDIETGVEKDEVFTHANQILCVGFSYSPGKAIVIGEHACADSDVRDHINNLLDTHGHLGAQNGKFDLQVMRHGTLFFDTMLASYALDERGTGIHGLEYMAVEHLGAPAWKTEFAKHSKGVTNYNQIPRQILYVYNGQDCCATYQLEDLFTERLEQEGLRHLHDRLVRYSNLLMEVEYEGVGFDMEYNWKLQKEYDELLGGLSSSMRKWVDNPRSWQQVTKAFRKMSIQVENTQADEIRLTLEMCEKKGMDEPASFARQLLKYKEHFKQESTYVRGLRERANNGRLYTTFKLHGTTTGRLASANPNLQNITRGDRIRRQFIPSPGNVFVQADYKAVELRVSAVESKDKYLYDLLRDPTRDIHGEVALARYGPNWNKENRIRAKAIVFGVPYGRTAHGIADEFSTYTNIMTTREAQDIIDTFMGLIPQVVEWREWIRKQVLSGQDLVTHFGRHHRVWLITRENVKDVINEAWAFIPQSTANDITLDSACRLQPIFGNSARLRIPVHDSLLFECHPSDAHDVGNTMAEIMTLNAKEIYSDDMPFPVDWSIAESWAM